MDVALRASQILAAEGYLRGAGDDRFWSDLLKSLLLHARFILDNLEDGPVRGNHYLSDLAGLYLCGLGLPEFREAPGWREFGRENLVSEMRRQVTGEGLDYEASLSYHAFVTEMFLFPALLGAEKGDPFPAPYLETLEKMLEAVAILIRPDGTLPQIGDNDDGRFLIFSQYHRPRRDWRPLLALGAFLFRRPEWLPLAGDAWVEGAWVLGGPFIRWRQSLSPPIRRPVPRRSAAVRFPRRGSTSWGPVPSRWWWTREGWGRETTAAMPTTTPSRSISSPLAGRSCPIGAPASTPPTLPSETGSVPPAPTTRSGWTARR